MRTTERSRHSWTARLVRLRSRFPRGGNPLILSCAGNSFHQGILSPISLNDVSREQSLSCPCKIALIRQISRAKAVVLWSSTQTFLSSFAIVYWWHANRLAFASINQHASSIMNKNWKLSDEQIYQRNMDSIDQKIDQTSPDERASDSRTFNYFHRARRCRDRRSESERTRRSIFVSTLSKLWFDVSHLYYLIKSLSSRQACCRGTGGKTKKKWEVFGFMICLR